MPVLPKRTQSIALQLPKATGRPPRCRKGSAGELQAATEHNLQYTLPGCDGHCGWTGEYLFNVF